MFYIKVDSYTEAGISLIHQFHQLWTWKTYIPGGGTTGLGTTYGNGLVFPGSFENHQMALDARTGTVVWDTLTKGPMIFNGAFSDGKFYRGGTDDNTLYCFSATDGKIIWTYTPENQWIFHHRTCCRIRNGL